MSQTEFREATFSAPSERIQRTTAVILNHVPTYGRLTVLDLGCGTGEQIYDLASALPLANLVGIDISRSNIQTALSDSRLATFRDRVTFQEGNYLDFMSDGFDVIISESVFHFIEGDTRALFRKVVSDLAENGLLVFTMPFSCRFNSFLVTVRRLARLLRGPATDKLILSIGRLLHRREMENRLLAERVRYSYVLPYRMDDTELERFLINDMGLEMLSRFALPHSTLASLKHRLSVYRRK